MLIALFSDIHANLEALDACLRHAREQGAERYAFLGDLVGYGADPAGVVEVVARYAAEGAVVLKGNHDEAVEKMGGYFNDASRAAIQWARETLTEEQKYFLATLPLVVRQGTSFSARLCGVSGTWDYIDSPSSARRCADAAQVAYTVLRGTCTDQVLLLRRRRGGDEGVPARRRAPDPGCEAIDAGSPSSDRWDNRATAIRRRPTRCRPRAPAGTFFRGAYDADAAADKIRKAGLPGSLAVRVESGI